MATKKTSLERDIVIGKLQLDVQDLKNSVKLLIEWRNDAALRIDTARQEAENKIEALSAKIDMLHNSMHNHEQRLRGQASDLELHRLETRREFQALSDWLAEKEAAPITGKDANPNDFRGFIYPDGKLHHAATDFVSNPACRPASGVTVPIEEYRALQERARNLAEALADLQKIVVNHEAGDRQAKFILIHGNPVDGCEYYGPLDTIEDAEELGDKLGGDWWIKELTL